MSKTKIELVTKTDAARLISRSMGDKLTDEGRKNLAKCSDCTTTVWAGYVDEELVCIWGLVPPTLLSEMAYLWLHTTEGVKDHEFIFVRRSQRAIQEVLKMYPLIVGHCEVGSPRSVRWLKWLGAVFAQPEGKMIPFMIKAQ